MWRQKPEKKTKLVNVKWSEEKQKPNKKQKKTRGEKE